MRAWSSSPATRRLSRRCCTRWEPRRTMRGWTYCRHIGSFRWPPESNICRLFAWDNRITGTASPGWAARAPVITCSGHLARPSESISAKESGYISMISSWPQIPKRSLCGYSVEWSRHCNSTVSSANSRSALLAPGVSACWDTFCPRVECGSQTTSARRSLASPARPTRSSCGRLWVS